MSSLQCPQQCPASFIVFANYPGKSALLTIGLVSWTLFLRRYPGVSNQAPHRSLLCHCSWILSATQHSKHVRNTSMLWQIIHSAFVTLPKPFKQDAIKKWLFKIYVPLRDHLIYRLHTITKLNEYFTRPSCVDQSASSWTRADTY